MKQAEELMAINLTVQMEKPLWMKDGSGVIYLSASTGSPEFHVAAADGSNNRQLTQHIGGMPFLASREPCCSPDGRYLAYLSNRADRSGEGLETDVWLQPLCATQEAHRLTRLSTRINSLQWAPDSGSLVLSASRYGRFDIFRVSVPSGQTQRLSSHDNYEVYPVFSADGEKIFFVRLNEKWTDHQVWMMDSGGGNQQMLFEDTDFFDYHYGRTFGYPLPSPQGSSVLFRSHRSGWINYWSWPLTEETQAEPLVPQEADQAEASWSPDGKGVAYIENHNGNLQLRVIDLDSGNVSIIAGENQGICAHPTWSPEGDSIAYLHGTTTSPLSLWVVDLKRDGDGRVKVSGRRRLSPVGDEKLLSTLVRPEKIVYPSFDGRQIPAYLYRPSSRSSPNSCPGIMWIHGGPTSQFNDSYQPQVQFFVERGYVVLLPNIRGSSGYGKEFEELNDRDWGGDDLRDVLVGADYLKTLTEVDAERLGIHGTSYGGCMSMSAVCFAPEAFQAAIPHGGYADWVHMYYEQELRHVQLLRYELGTPEDHSDVYHRCSPYYHLEHMETPTLVLHGTGKNPESAASKRFYEEARRLYKPVRYKAYPKECYYVNSMAGVKEMLWDMLKFFDEQLKGL